MFKRLLAVPAADSQRNILATEAERIIEGDSDLGFTGLVGDVVEVAFGIGIFEIDGWRQDAIAHGQQADDHFRDTGGSDQVSHHAFGA